MVISISDNALVYLRSKETNLKEIHQEWNSCDILILSLDMTRHLPVIDFLTEVEKDTIFIMKSEYIQRRFILSRTLLKILLAEILQKKSVNEISLSKNNQNRIRVNESDYPWISLSYSKNYIAFFLAKRKAAGDVEVVRPCSFNLNKYPAFSGLMGDMSLESQLARWERWTRVESYTKLFGIPLIEGLRDLSFGKGNSFQSILIDYTLMCSVCSVDKELRISVLSWNGDLRYTDVLHEAVKVL